MKKSILLLLALLLCTGGTFAQKAKSTRSSLSTSISDDDKELSIQIKGTVNGKYINFDRTYDVAKLSKKEKEKLKNSIMDSLGVSMPTPPTPPLPPTPPVPPTPPHSPNMIGVYSEKYPSKEENHYPKGMAEIRVTCDKCPTKGKFSLISTDKNSHVIISFDEDDKDSFPLIFKAKDGRYTFKYEYGNTSFSETLTLKKNDVIIKKL
jgi:hypothetical protein